MPALWDILFYGFVFSAAFLASLMTFFSGFGLATILMPLLAIFFPLTQAVSLTAVIHLLNNLFKAALLAKHAHKEIILKFGLPAIPTAYMGALCLAWFSSLPSIYHYSFLGREAEVSLLKLLMAGLIMFFAAMEFIPQTQGLSCDRKYLPLGGLITGFFGGLSGHQGVFRTMFLIRCGLTKEAFLATAVIIAVIIDFTRILVYGTQFQSERPMLGLLLVTLGGAFLGTWFGSRYLTRMTFAQLRLAVGSMLFLIGLGLGLGIL